MDWDMYIKIAVQLLGAAIILAMLVALGASVVRTIRDNFKEK